MITKFLEAFFRHKLLVLLPPLLIPLLVGPWALMTAPIYYESFAGVWVDKPTYLNYNDNFSIYSSASSQQANKLSEQLRTRSFMVEVAKPEAFFTAPQSERTREFLGKILHH